MITGNHILDTVFGWYRFSWTARYRFFKLVGMGFSWIEYKGCSYSLFFIRPSFLLFFGVC